MSLTPGATLGPYAILAELGHGGMGVVYTAHDPRLDRQIGLSYMTRRRTDDRPAMMERMAEEAHVTGKLLPCGRLGTPRGRVERQ